MVNFNSLVTSVKALMAVSSLIFSVTDAYPLAGRDYANSTIELPPLIPDRIVLPSIDLIKRDDSVLQATAAQISTYTKYAGIAATAYCETVVPQNIWNCQQCLKQVPDGKLITTFSTILADTTGFLLRSDNEKVIYLVFRGTSSIRSAIADMVYAKLNYPPVSGTGVHTGFWASFQEARLLYQSKLQSQLQSYPSYKVIISGHSLGGAQALLAGLDIYQRYSNYGPSNLAIHTVGSPRVGDSAFANYVASTRLTYSRSVNKNDIVPHLPPKSFSFLHAGVEIWTKSSTDIKICTSTIESSKCTDSIESSLELSIPDHLTYYGIDEGSCL